MKIDSHFYWSMVKSALRVFAGVALVTQSFWLAGTLLISAEVFGVIEEL